MKKSAMGVLVIILGLVLFGCNGTGGERMNGTDYPEGVPLDGSDEGAGNLEEEEIVVVFRLEMKQGQHLIHLSVLVTWRDDDPVEKEG